MTLRLWAALAVLTTAVAASPLSPSLAAQVTQSLDSTLLAGFRWRNIGPANMGGRVSSVVGIPGPSKTFFIAGAAGGGWKTPNAGTPFQPGLDNHPCISLGGLAFARPHPPQLSPRTPPHTPPH